MNSKEPTQINDPTSPLSTNKQAKSWRKYLDSRQELLLTSWRTSSSSSFSQPATGLADRLFHGSLFWGRIRVFLGCSIGDFDLHCFSITCWSSGKSSGFGSGWAGNCWRGWRLGNRHGWWRDTRFCWFLQLVLSGAGRCTRLLFMLLWNCRLASSCCWHRSTDLLRLLPWL